MPHPKACRLPAPLHQKLSPPLPPRFDDRVRRLLDTANMQALTVCSLLPCGRAVKVALQIFRRIQAALTFCLRGENRESLSSSKGPTSSLSGENVKTSQRSSTPSSARRRASQESPKSSFESGLRFSSPIGEDYV